ncbi:MAG: hypothetical protein QOD42_3319 [Sphingomonadales bacterium]|nr:hypothetical protein [Sphingomonadales bacterium]
MTGAAAGTIDRRALLAAAAAGLSALAAGSAEACSLTGTRNVPFEDRACRRRIRDWAALLERGPGMTDAAIDAAAEAIGGWVDRDIVVAVLGDRVPPSPDRPVRFYQEFRLSAGRPDPRPIRISELNLLRRVGSRAVYQFALDRYSYHPADHEGCNGMFVHDEFYGVDRVAYLATFSGNQLQQIKWFEDWPLEPRA